MEIMETSTDMPPSFQMMMTKCGRIAFDVGPAGVGCGCPLINSKDLS
jgi:hypothetical protein